MSIEYRRTTPDDNFITFTICCRALEDFSKHSGVKAITGANDPETRLSSRWLYGLDLMSDEPFGKFTNYLLSSPPYFL